ncbi:4'-phosphopantetheinyl transferase superfamily protein [Pseudaeromonas sp. ZJS20]|uniref:4'-phosphopantetheinyl transferase family protein n=1 Tax=Pseudaeromonas aegiceratis TaxID=3153928 RepID=UPI00390CCAB5
MLFLYRWSVQQPRLTDCLAWLDERERLRLAQLRQPHLADQYAHAHLGLRCLLGQMRGEHPSALRFEVGENGKPTLVGGPHFSLSHAAGYALLAISTQAPVGVDLEAVDPHSAMDWLPPLLSAEERMRQQQLGPAWSPWRFWVRKEAWLKALGHGLTRWGSTPVCCHPEAGCYPVTDQGGWVRDLCLSSPWIGALAWSIDRPLPPVPCLEIQLARQTKQFHCK